MPSGATERVQGDGSVSNRDLLSDGSFLSEISSALASEYWTGPAVRVYPLKLAEQPSQHYSARRTHAALNRRDVVIDLPAFLPP